MELEGKKVLVVGLARTGIGVVRFLAEQRARVMGTDIRSANELGPYLSKIRGLDVVTELGEHRTGTFLRSDLIVVSPGVPLNIAPIAAARQNGIEVISEIELACRFIRDPIIGVSGTNGKTTTSIVLGNVLKLSGKEVFVGGNVGNPLIDCAGLGNHDYVVAEISSFQLEGIHEFRPHIALMLNITEDHLDRYPRYEEYVRAKFRLFLNQRASDFAVLNADDATINAMSSEIKARKSYFSLTSPLNAGAFFDRDSLVYRDSRGEVEGFKLARVPLKGIHNIENMLSVVITAKICSCPKEAIQTALESFKGLPHRLEFVRELDGVRYYNDSKGTNVGSVVKSLRSFQEPIILIAGGKDKGGTYEPLEGIVKEKVKCLILIGEARQRMGKAFGGLVSTTEADTLEEAVHRAFDKSKRGDVVLLSPACSSFDMFRDYEQRGNLFKEIVNQLGRGQKP
ncbi:MAG: UDP-N-acetylmuramoyl-L-alanine--D-glutamate ligase [Thermodesulfobacteriota bacterium]